MRRAAILAAALTASGCTCGPFAYYELATRTGSPATFRAPDAPHPGLGGDDRGDFVVAGEDLVYAIVGDAVARETLAGVAVLAGVTDAAAARGREFCPSAIAATAPRGAYALDPCSDAVLALGADGSVRRLFGRPGVGKGGIAAAKDGTLYVADPEGKEVGRLAPDGTFAALAGKNQGLQEPRAVAIDGDRGLVVVDNDRVVRVALDGTVTQLAAGPRDENGQSAQPGFSGAQHLVVDGAGTIFVSEPVSGRVRQVAPDGTVAVVIQVRGAWGNPGGLAVDARGRAVVATEEGLLALRSDGTSDGLLPAPPFDAWRAKLGTIGGAGLVAVDGHDPRRVHHQAADGGWTSVPLVRSARPMDGRGADARLDRPEGLAMDAAGRLVVADAGTGRVRRVSTDGEVTTLAGGEPEHALPLVGPTDVVVEASSAIVIADPAAGRIVRIAPDGARTVVSTALAHPRRLAAAPGGGWYVVDGAAFEDRYDSEANRARRVVRLDAAGARVPFLAPEEVTIPTDVAVDAAGRLYVADNPHGPRIRRLGPAGSFTTLVEMVNDPAPGSRFKLQCLPPPQPIASDVRLGVGPGDRLWFRRPTDANLLTVADLP